MLLPYKGSCWKLVTVSSKPKEQWVEVCGSPNNNLRGQDDDTTCEQMLSKKCVEALTERAATIADWMVTNPTLRPYSNLTPPILAPICLRIQEDIGAVEDSMPAGCRPYFWAGDQSGSSANSDREYPTIDEWGKDAMKAIGDRK